MEDENKNYLGLLSGIVRHDYFDDGELTDDFLKQQLYEDMSPDMFQKLTTRLRGLIKSMAMTNMDVNQAEIFLTSQAKKKDANMTDSQFKVLLKFWKSHRSKIHESLLDTFTWNKKLKQMNWRIDVKSQDRTREQMMEKTAIVELQLENRHSHEKKVEVIQFEIDEKGLGKVLQSIKEIEEQLEMQSK